MKTKSIITALLLLLMGAAVGQTGTKVAVFKVRKVEAIESVEEIYEEAPIALISIPDEPPIYPGGDDSLRAFIARNVDYPEQARVKEIQGRVYVRFCVTYKGGIDQVSVLRGVHPLLDSAAVAVVKKLPKWTPSIQGGHHVNVLFTVPINFSLQK